MNMAQTKGRWDMMALVDALILTSIYGDYSEVGGRGENPKPMDI